MFSNEGDKILDVTMVRGNNMINQLSVHKQIYSISVILKFYREKGDLENSLKKFLRREIAKKYIFFKVEKCSSRELVLITGLFRMYFLIYFIRLLKFE